MFADPQTFDIHRRPNPHLSLGKGVHFRLGAHLARLESRVFLAELLASFPSIDIGDEPVRVRSKLNNSFTRLPVRFSAEGKQPRTAVLATRAHS